MISIADTLSTPNPNQAQASSLLFRLAEELDAKVWRQLFPQNDVAMAKTTLFFLYIQRKNQLTKTLATSER